MVEPVQRRLAAIFAADVLGYGRLIREDEEGTLHAVKSDIIEAFNPSIAAHNGRIFKTIGDGLLVEFASVVDAVRCAVEVQRAMRDRNAERDENRKIEFRIGINLGDVVAEGEDLHGDGVNVASRLEGLADAGGICISGSAYEQVRDKLKVGFEDIGDQSVKNIDRPVRAYRVAPDRAERLAAQKADNAAVGARPWRRLTVAAAMLVVIASGGLALWHWLPQLEPVETADAEGSHSDKPSIAVLSYTNLSDDKEQEYFSDGLTEDLITDLSRISGLTVIARTSTFAYKGQSKDIRTIGNELNARYIVEGSVRRIGKRVRISTQLIEAETGNHIWADRFDRSVADLFDLQDDVRHKIVQALNIELSSREERWLASKPTDSPEAYDAYLRGLRQESYFTHESNAESRRLFRKAIELDPSFAAAYAHLAQAYALAKENGWMGEGADADKAIELAKKAVELDDELPQAHWSLARTYTRPPRRDVERGMAEIRRALDLDPNYADGYAFLASMLNASGRSEEALGAIERAMRINPHFPFWYIFELGRAQFFLTRYEASVESFEKAIERNPTVPWPHRYALAAYGHLGSQDAAEWEIFELETLNQVITIRNVEEITTVRDATYRDLFFDGLRKAGVPEM